MRHPHNCFTPEGGSNTIVYCEARDNYFIRRIDLTKMEVTNDVKVAGDPRPFIVTADEKTLYTALSGLHGVAVIDIPGKTMSQIALPPMPWMSCKVEPPNTPVHGLALTADGKKLWITSVADSGHYVYDIATKKLGKKITVGECPNWISMSKDGKYATVSNADSDDASILDAQQRKGNRPDQGRQGAQAAAGDRSAAGTTDRKIKQGHGDAQICDSAGSDAGLWWRHWPPTR